MFGSKKKIEPSVKKFVKEKLGFTKPSHQLAKTSCELTIGRNVRLDYNRNINVVYQGKVAGQHSYQVELLNSGVSHNVYVPKGENICVLGIYYNDVIVGKLKEHSKFEVFTEVYAVRVN